MSFPDTSVGGTASMTVTLTNGSSMAVSLGGWSIAGASEFRLGTTTCGASLAASSSCTQVVTFSPLSAGAKTATLSASAGASVTLNGTAPLAAVYRVNCGSSTAVSPFTADQYASGGTQHTVTNTINVSGVTNAAPQAVYQSERYGSSTYTFPGLTASAQYTVRLHFAEIYWTATGS